jgi:hypothetical protein
MEQAKLWVEPVGNIIVARLRGECTEDMLKECQERVLLLIQETQRTKVLYDALEMQGPSIDLVLIQQKLETETQARLGPVQLRKAILVPDTRIAYLSRIAFGQFGEGAYRVFFYNDVSQAVLWLEEQA